MDSFASWKPKGSARYEPREGFSFSEIVARDQHLGPRLFGHGGGALGS